MENDQSINQSLNQSINQSINQTFNQSINQLINPSVLYVSLDKQELRLDSKADVSSDRPPSEHNSSSICSDEGLTLKTSAF